MSQHKTTDAMRLERLRRIEHAAHRLLSHLITRHGIPNAEGFTCPHLPALYEAVTEADRATRP